MDSFSALNDYFLTLAAERDVEFMIVAGLLVFVVLASSYFLRITRWPLANIFVTLLVLFLILLLYNFLVFSLIVTLEKIIGSSLILVLIPNAVLAFCAALFFLLDFVLLPERRRKRDYA